METDPNITELEHYVAAHPIDDDAYFRLGNAYVKGANWREAIRCYLTAIEINPASPAREAHKMIIDILEFRNTDLYNP
ncbi:MAG: tetratricopeptide repeat protein [Bacteroidales bacterium]